MTTPSPAKLEAIKIAVFGAAREPEARNFLGWIPTERRLAEDLGEMLGKAFGDKTEILTGGCIGVPDLVASSARRYGVRVIGYSGARSMQEHVSDPNYARPERFDEIRFTNPSEVVLNGLAERSLRMIRDAHALVYLGGRTGTLTEYFVAFDGTHKPMYVLRGSGGAVDRIPRLHIKKHRGTGIVFETGNVFDLVSRLDDDLGISDFKDDPEIQIVDERVPSMTWTQFAYGGIDPNKRIIFRRD